MKLLSSDYLYTILSKKLNEPESRLFISNVEFYEDSVCVNVEISYCSCCQPSKESVDITESDFEELLNNVK